MSLADRPVNDPVVALSTPDSVPPLVINERYRVIRELADGPLGSLYVAEDLRTRARVMLRMLGRELAGDEQVASALERHALRLAGLCINSESVVKVRDLERAGEAGFLMVMEHVSGETLTSVMQADGALPVARALHLAIQLARGLQAAHAVGLVHGALTPDNVVVTDIDEIKLMDFGLAELWNAAATKTPGSATVIDPEYLAPEQFQSGEITGKTDIYAFGTLLYQMLCGAVPFTTAGLSIALAKQLYEPPGLPGNRRRSVPRTVERIVRKMLARQPDDRPEIAAVIEELGRDVHRPHESRVGRHARLALHALSEAVAAVVLTARQSRLKWKLGFASCGLLIVLSVATIWIPVSRPMLAAPSPQRPAAVSQGAEGTRPLNPSALEPTVSTPETPRPNALPEITASPKKVAPLAATKKRVTSRQRASRPAPAEDSHISTAASSDPSDPAGVIDWLLKESARNR